MTIDICIANHFMELSSSILQRNTLGALLQGECEPQEAETSAQGPVEICSLNLVNVGNGAGPEFPDKGNVE